MFEKAGGSARGEDRGRCRAKRNPDIRVLLALALDEAISEAVDRLHVVRKVVEDEFAAIGLHRQDGVAFVVLVAAPASAAEIPKFNYALTCRDTPPVAMDQKATFDQCMADEKSARDSLPPIWARSSAQARAQCCERGAVFQKRRAGRCRPAGAAVRGWRRRRCAPVRLRPAPAASWSHCPRRDSRAGYGA